LALPDSLGKGLFFIVDGRKRGGPVRRCQQSRSARLGGTQAVSLLTALMGAAVLLATLLPAGCGGGGARPVPVGLPPAGPSALAPPVMTEYLVHVGDELRILVVDQPEFTAVVKVKPDGKISVPGAGEVLATGRSLQEITEEIRTELLRLIRYPDVSVMLSSFVYVLGEVRVPGDHAYMPEMTVLHALGAAAGAERSAKLSSVLVLRRTGPSSLDVYRVDLEAAVDGNAMGRDLYLQPYDVVFVPRTFIAEVNNFVDQFIRQNISPFSAYIEGWRALNLADIYWRRPTD
jgi:protein involved in polysaccharide export with SLBB domain